MLELVAEDFRSFVVEVSVGAPPPSDGVDYPVDDLTQRRLPGRAALLPTEVLLGEDVRGVYRPPGGNLDVSLFEGDAAVAVVD